MDDPYAFLAWKFTRPHFSTGKVSRVLIEERSIFPGKTFALFTFWGFVVCMIHNFYSLNCVASNLERHLLAIPSLLRLTNGLYC
jgi:hypothetical protein